MKTAEMSRENFDMSKLIELYDEDYRNIKNEFEISKIRKISLLIREQESYRNSSNKLSLNINHNKDKVHLLEYIKTLRVEEIMEYIQKEIEKCKEDININKVDLPYFNDMVNKTQESIENTNNSSPNVWSMETLLKEIPKIITHPMFEKIDINKGNALISTKTLYIHEEYTGRYYLLGKMIIEIPLKKDNGIKFINTTTTRDGYEAYMRHPHVFSSGNACFGGYSARISDYIYTDDFYALFCTLIEFLQDVDIDDCAGVYVCAWDEVDEDGNVITEGHRPEPDEYNGYGYELEPRTECYRCGREIPEDEAIYCYHCDESFCPDCIEYVEKKDRYVCPTCLENLYFICDDCDKYEHIDDAYYIEDIGTHVCEDCYEDGDYHRCPDCEDFFSENGMVYDEIEEEWVCEKCYKMREECREDKENENDI